MKVKTYKTVNYILFGIAFALTAVSLYLETPLFALAGAGGYMFIISLLRTTVVGMLADERQEEVAAKASQTSFTILLPILLFTSIGLLMGWGEREFAYLDGLGTILMYVTCFALLIYLLSYWFYDRKTGGK